jgi:hypothetical protein
MNFKIGQKVRIIGNCNGSCNRVGDIGVVTIETTQYFITNGWQVFQVKVPGRGSYGNHTRTYDMAPIDINPNIKVL